MTGHVGGYKISQDVKKHHKILVQRVMAGPAKVPKHTLTSVKPSDSMPIL